MAVRPYPRIGLIGPDRTQPCGIADYTDRLAEAMAGKCDLVRVPFRTALTDPALTGCHAILVQYERSLVPSGDFLPRLSALYPGRVHVVPHEVYGEDPFAFPYDRLRSAFPPLLWLKRLRYRLRHREYAAEKRLQAAAYGAHRVIPLSAPGAEILRSLAGEKILDPVPLAFYVPPESGSPQAYFPDRPRTLIGIFGFLNPGLDYVAVLDVVAGMHPGVCLLILGGPRDGEGVERWLREEVAARGLSGRVRVSGYIPAERLGAQLRTCDMFLSPMRFKSNSASLLSLIHLGKPILAADLPLTRFLREQGAPLELYADGEELRSKIEAVQSGRYRAPANRYPWDFGAVADAYLRILAAAPGPPVLNS